MDLTVIVTPRPKDKELYRGHSLEIHYLAEAPDIVNLIASFTEGLYEVVHQYLEEKGSVDALVENRTPAELQVLLTSGNLLPMARCPLDVAPLPYRWAQFYMRTQWNVPPLS